MKLSRSRHKGFTLVELLIVIAIITLLMAIAMPIMTRAREKARQTACMVNLHNIHMAIRMYRIDEGAYPGPYDPVSGRGGMNALYPQYLESRNALICPSDRNNAQSYVKAYANLLSASGNMYYWQDADSFSKFYSSYNGYYNWIGYVYFLPPSGSGDIPSKTYPQLGGGSMPWPLRWGDNIAEVHMWGRYGYNYPWYYAYYVAQQIYWSGYDPTNPNTNDPTRFKDALGRPLWELADPNWYPFGQPSGSFPGLINRNAPDNTIITRCHHHRRYTIGKVTDVGPATGRGSQMMLDTQDEMELEECPRDIVLRLDGSAKLEPLLSFNWAIQPR